MTGFAAAGALVRIADHRILDDLAADDGSGRAMVSAELAAEARIGYVLVGQNEVDSVGVGGQVLGLECVGHDLLNLAVAAQALSQRIIVVVVILGSVVHLVRDELVGAVTVGGIDLFLRRTPRCAK